MDAIGEADGTIRKWPRWVSIPVASAIGIILITVVVAAIALDRWRNADDRGLGHAEARVTALLPETSVLESTTSSPKSWRSKTYLDPRGREAVETDLREKLGRANLLYPRGRDPVDDSIPLRTGPRYYAEVQFKASSGNATRFEIFTYIED